MLGSARASSPAAWTTEGRKEGCQAAGPAEHGASQDVHPASAGGHPWTVMVDLLEEVQGGGLMGGGQELGCSNLTSAEVGGSEELHTLVAGQQMWAWTRWELGRAVGDADGAKALNKEASGVASHQDTSLELAQQALGGSLRAGLGKYHLLHAALGAGGLSHEAAVQALHLGLTHHVPIVDEGEHQGVVCGQRATCCTKCLSPRVHSPVSIGSGETQRGSCKPNVLVLLLRNVRPRQETRQGLGRTRQAVEWEQQLHCV